jgi:hypothetical protein
MDLEASLKHWIILFDEIYSVLLALLLCVRFYSLNF